MRNGFTWDQFGARFLRSIVYSQKTKPAHRPKATIYDQELLIPYMDRIARRPTDAFVRCYLDEIFNVFLTDGEHLENIIRALVALNMEGVKPGTVEEMLAQLRGLPLSSTLITLIIAEFERHAGCLAPQEEVSIFQAPKFQDLRGRAACELPLFDYQQEAVERLIEHFVTRDMRGGVLVMPTGSGKTRVATRFLLQEMVGRGHQVIWLTHRAMLIEQAAGSIYQAAPILKRQDPGRERFKMVCVSGSYASIHSLEADDDVMVFGVQTLCRNLSALNDVLRNNVLIVVDEAHHLVARSYQSIIDHIRSLRPSAKLLGLTATPVRMEERETARLMKHFENSVIYSVSMASLIAKGVLARPHCVRIDTNVDFATQITFSEKEYIRKWGELPPETVDRVARTAERNALIVDTYLKNRSQYGRTLVFALNAIHCISLSEAFQKKGIRCDYIYCAHDGNAEKIARFQRGELDVLVNINIMTEGSDVPEIQTVFLTRPTSSDVLLLQMIGRGMRGKDCGGTETLNVVDFHDIWGSFADWLNPKFAIPEHMDEQEPAAPSPRAYDPEMVPWAMIRDLFDGVQTDVVGGGEDDMALPSGWYDVLDDSGNDRKILVFESQLEGYAAMWREKQALRGNPKPDGVAARRRWFGDMGWLPSTYDLGLLIEHYLENGQIPHLYPFAGYRQIDAARIGLKLKDSDARLSEIEAEVDQLCAAHRNMIESVYGSSEAFRRRVYNFAQFPSGVKPLGMKIAELPQEFLTLDRTPFHNLQALAQEVIVERFGGEYPFLPEIDWTDRPNETYFGMFMPLTVDESRGRETIRINCLLNSEDVPREAVKFVLYHEFLHRNHRRHDNTFRERERQFPDYYKWQRFLDFTFPKFDTRYSM